MFSNDRNIETIGQLIESLKHYIGLQQHFLKLDVVVKKGWSKEEKSLNQIIGY